jgi:hypothetical protein
MQEGPRNLGMALVILGTTVLIAATIQYWLMLRHVRRSSGEKFPLSLSVITAAALSVVGLVAVLNVVFRFGPFRTTPVSWDRVSSPTVRGCVINRDLGKRDGVSTPQGVVVNSRV